jgi:sterol carrier protein 2
MAVIGKSDENLIFFGTEIGSFRLGYNHAHECRPITMADVDKVKSRKETSAYVLQHAKL